MRVLIADDHPATRVGIRYCLQPADIEVVAEVGSAGDAVERALALKPDVALIDIHMPGDGIRAVERIRSEAPQIACVVLTSSDDDRELFRALKAGAVGYVLKDTDLERLPLAVEAVVRGESVLPRNLVMSISRNLGSPLQQRRSIEGVEADLTEREWEVMDCLRDGMTTAQIASKLGLSQATVRSHIAAIVRKLQVSDRHQAVAKLEGREV